MHVTLHMLTGQFWKFEVQSINGQSSYQFSYPLSRNLYGVYRLNGEPFMFGSTNIFFYLQKTCMLCLSALKRKFHENEFSDLLSLGKNLTAEAYSWECFCLQKFLPLK